MRRGNLGRKSGDRHKRDFPEQHSVGFSRLPWPSVRRSGHVNASGSDGFAGVRLGFRFSVMTNFRVQPLNF